MLSAETVLPNVEVETDKTINYSETYKVDKSSSSKVTQDLVDTPQTMKKKVVLNGFNPITNPMPQGGYSRFELKEKGL